MFKKIISKPAAVINIYISSNLGSSVLLKVLATPPNSINQNVFYVINIYEEEHMLTG
jgi:hypothetical protein